eukprot:EC690837.1.p3 GENE.EC690837.1~~EC690837.1.p3  ORF type:complete len:119 (+),score=4.66 EC690837.1:141-497(+)
MSSGNGLRAIREARVTHRRGGQAQGLSPTPVEASGSWGSPAGKYLKSLYRHSPDTSPHGSGSGSGGASVGGSGGQPHSSPPPAPAPPPAPGSGCRGTLLALAPAALSAVGVGVALSFG